MVLSVPISQIIAQVIADLSLGDANQNNDWGIVVAEMPIDPDRVIVVSDTKGVSSGKIMRSGEDIIHHGVQIITRSKAYDEAWIKGRAIQTTLSALSNRAVSVTNGFGTYNFTLEAFSLFGTLIPMGEEEKNRRNLVSFNGLLTINED